MTLPGPVVSHAMSTERKSSCTESSVTASTARALAMAVSNSTMSLSHKADVLFGWEVMRMPTW
jgi:hypothetical protein